MTKIKNQCNKLLYEGGNISKLCVLLGLWTFFVFCSFVHFFFWRGSEHARMFGLSFLCGLCFVQHMSLLFCVGVCVVRDVAKRNSITMSLMASLVDTLDRRGVVYKTPLVLAGSLAGRLVSRRVLPLRRRKGNKYMYVSAHLVSSQPAM